MIEDYYIDDMSAAYKDRSNIPYGDFDLWRIFDNNSEIDALENYLRSIGRLKHNI